MRTVPLVHALLVAALGTGFLLAGPAAGIPVADGPVQFFPITPTQSVNLGESVTYTLAVYNGDESSAYLIQAGVLEAGLGFSAQIAPDHLFLAPGESGRLDLTLGAPEARRSGVASVLLELRAVNLDTQAEDVGEFPVEVELRGIPPESVPVGKVLGIWPNPLPEPLDGPAGAFALTVAVWVLVALGVVYGLGPVARSFLERSQRDVTKILIRILRGPIFVLLLGYGAVSSLEILGISPQLRLSLRQGFSFFVILTGTWIAYRLYRDILIYYANRLARESERDIGTRMLPNLEKVGALVIVAVGLAFAFQRLGVDLTILLAGLGVVGIIVAFAAQDTLSNFFAGLHIMLDRPFQVGDIVEIEPGVICEVRDIGLRSTKLYWGKEHDILILPNKDLANRKIVNYLRPDLRFKTNVKVGVAYGTDLEKVERVLMDIAKGHPDIITDQPGYEPLFRVAEFQDNAILLLIIFTVRDARLQWGVRSDITRAIDKRFKEEGITIAFPQRDVWVRRWPGGDLPPTEPTEGPSP